MNLLHLRYALEVERTSSISKAAENLYMGQPNLSRAIKELEETLGLTIFRRTSRGIAPTPEGAEFLEHAREIMEKVEQVEALYKGGSEERQRFSISVPRASYIADAFAHFARQLDAQTAMELYFRETNAMRAINNVLIGECNLGIIRYQTSFEPYFGNLLYEKGLRAESVSEYSYLALMHRTHPLAEQESVTVEQLADYIEIAHGDPYVPSLSVKEARRAELTQGGERQIFVFERASQFDLLTTLPGCYMWVSAIPQRLLDCYGLVQKPCYSQPRCYRDVLLCKKSYSLSSLDKLFMEQLEQSKGILNNLDIAK